MKFTQIRHGSHILTYQGKKILVDPVLADAGTYEPIPYKGNQGKNPLIPLPFSIEEILQVDVILLTHLHNDHFDETTKSILPRNFPIICHDFDRGRITSQGFTQVIGVKKEDVILENIKITTIQGRHGYGITAKAMGHVSGFVLEDVLRTEPKVYIIGDSVFVPEVEKALLEHKPDITVVFGGEARILRSRPITMGYNDIQKIASTLPSTKIIVNHCDAWNHCSMTRKKLRAFLEDQPFQNRVWIPEDGEELEVSSLLI